MFYTKFVQNTSVLNNCFFYKLNYNMFTITQIILNKLKNLPRNNLSMYTIIYGIIIYTILYVYIVIYKQELTSYIYTFSIYIILIDIFLSLLYNWNLKECEKLTDDINLSTKLEDNTSISNTSYTLTENSEENNTIDTIDIKKNIIKNIEKELEKSTNNTIDIELKSKKINESEINKFLETESFKDESFKYDNTTSIALKIPLPELEKTTIKEESSDYNNNLKKRRGRPKKIQNE